MALSAAAMILALIAVAGLACALIGLWWNMCDRRSGCAALLILIGLACLIATHAGARDDGRYAQSPLKGWFDGLKSGKGPCCSDADGSAVSDVDWEVRDGHYRVRLEGKWWNVPDDAVITEPNRAGVTMVWPMYYRDLGSLRTIDIRCFMPGSMT